MEIVASVSAILAHKGTRVWSIAPDATVFEALKLMAEKNIGALPVMQGDRLVGILSERDYARKIVLVGKSSRETQVAEILSRDLVVASPKSTVAECMRLMTEHRIRHLPVLDGEKVVGVVSIGDLVNWIISTQSSVIEQLESYITGQYPG
ncbi:MAG: CBS domain-containing protein [Verrucomicrobia bacterium]|nr:CBS domain-containing protein [Verrucomicrobiota bacterium]